MYLVLLRLMIASSSDLIYFLEVSSTLNLSHAAKRLGVTQPSLTFAMQRLEKAVAIRPIYSTNLRYKVLNYLFAVKEGWL